MKTKQTKPAPRTRALFIEAARHVAGGANLSEAGQRAGITAARFEMLRWRYPDLWKAELDRAMEEKRRQGPAKSDPTRPHRAARRAAFIRQVVSMMGEGLTWNEIAKRLGINPRRIEAHQRKHRDLWDLAVRAAGENYAPLVRQMAGTDAVLGNPRQYLAMAETAQRWATGRGEALFPPGDKPTLTTFYREYYLPTRLADGSPRGSRALFEIVLRRWALVTGDPPIDQITPVTLAKFKAFMGKLKGFAGQTISPRTMADYLQCIQALLDKAGPPSKGNRDGAGLIEVVPWIKPPKAPPRAPVIAPVAAIAAAYRAAELTDNPAWWKALLVVVYNCGVRRRTLFELRWEWVDWTAGIITVPAAALKSNRPQVFWINDTTRKHLEAIRGDGELVFPMPHGFRRFHRLFHQLQDLAGIPRASHFGLHSIRKTHATALFQSSPQAAQLSLGHTSLTTTVGSYVQAAAIVGPAIHALPQPAAFLK